MFSIRIPPMLVQPYVENAIRHGLLPRPEGGKVTVAIREREGYIVCTVEDDGIGRVKSHELKPGGGATHRSMGMMLTGRRLEIYNAVRKREINVEITDLYADDGTPRGTRVEMHVPIDGRGGESRMNDSDERRVGYYDSLDYRR